VRGSDAARPDRGRYGGGSFETASMTKSYVTVRSEVGDPVQLSDFRPVACEKLVRIGSPNDGGYVVPLDAVKASGALLSFGLAHDWTFERDFKKHNPGAIVHCYDHTVSFPTVLAYSFGQLLRAIVRLDAGHLRKAFAWIDYPLFFRTDRIHFRQRVWRDRQDNSVTVDDAFARLPEAVPTFVKVDIEGSEYRILDDLLRHSPNITALAIEFHDVDIVPELFNSFVERIKRDFYIVHIHGNNLGGLAPFHFPIAPEITFLNKRFFASAPALSGRKYPIPELDRPNYPGLPDFALEF
jgi:Methyltransferase FkbM domain